MKTQRGRTGRATAPRRPATARQPGRVSLALVLTGETTVATLQRASAAERPDYVLDRVDALLPESVWRDLGGSAG